MDNEHGSFGDDVLTNDGFENSADWQWGGSPDAVGWTYSLPPCSCGWVGKHSLIVHLWRKYATKERW